MLISVYHFLWLFHLAVFIYLESHSQMFSCVTLTPGTYRIMPLTLGCVCAELLQLGFSFQAHFLRSASEFIESSSKPVRRLEPLPSSSSTESRESVELVGKM